MQFIASRQKYSKLKKYITDLDRSLHQTEGRSCHCYMIVRRSFQLRRQYKKK